MENSHKSVHTFKIQDSNATIGKCIVDFLKIRRVGFALAQDMQLVASWQIETKSMRGVSAIWLMLVLI